MPSLGFAWRRTLVALGSQFSSVHISTTAPFCFLRRVTNTTYLISEIIQRLKHFFIFPPPLVICKTEVLFIPAGYLIVEKALVSHNVAYRMCSGVMDYASFKCLEHALQFYPMTLDHCFKIFSNNLEFLFTIPGSTMSLIHCALKYRLPRSPGVASMVEYIKQQHSEDWEEQMAQRNHETNQEDRVLLNVPSSNNCGKARPICTFSSFCFDIRLQETLIIIHITIYRLILFKCP